VPASSLASLYGRLGHRRVISGSATDAGADTEEEIRRLRDLIALKGAANKEPARRPDL